MQGKEERKGGKRLLPPPEGEGESGSPATWPWRRTARLFRAHGDGLPLPSEQIARWQKVRFVLLTRDLDFGAILASSGANIPGAIQIRTEDLRPDVRAGRVASIVPRLARLLPVPTRLGRQRSGPASAAARLILVLFVAMALVAVLAAMLAAVVIVPVMPLAVFLPVFRDVLIVVPTVLHKVDRPATRVVLAAVLAPILLMPRGHVKINRRGSHADTHGLNNDRLRKDQLRRPGKSAYFDVAEEARLSNAYRNSGVRLQRQESRCENRGQGQ